MFVWKSNVDVLREGSFDLKEYQRNQSEKEAMAEPRSEVPDEGNGERSIVEPRSE